MNDYSMISGWNIKDGDYISDEPSYVKRHQLAKILKTKEVGTIYITLGAAAFIALILFLSLTRF